MDVVEQKPQEKFRDTFDNSYAPFKPKLSKKVGDSSLFLTTLTPVI